MKTLLFAVGNIDGFSVTYIDDDGETQVKKVTPTPEKAGLLRSLIAAEAEAPVTAVHINGVTEDAISHDVSSTLGDGSTFVFKMPEEDATARQTAIAAARDELRAIAVSAL